MNEPSLSIIIPTKGRSTLQRVISLIRPQLGPEDEVIVIGDGQQLVARGVLSIPDWRYHYFETKQTNDWGCTQRNFGMAYATKDFLCFVDDDDTVYDTYIEDTKAAIQHNRSNIHIFELEFGRERMAPELRRHHIAGACFVPPNNKNKLGVWRTEDGSGDWPFIHETLQFYSPEAPIFHPVCVYKVEKYNQGN
jgi:glycosyltransferase involved in cell wall biosynthesis